jgi:cell division protein FtsI/penicillin-binding protein 2
MPRLLRFLLFSMTAVGFMIAIETAPLGNLAQMVADVRESLTTKINVELPIPTASLKAEPEEKPQNAPQQVLLTRQDVRALLDPSLLVNSETSRIVIQGETEKFFVETTLDSSLQGLLIQNLEKLKTLTRGKPQRIGLVAMEPLTGRIVAMAGFDLDDPGANPCTMGDYPAASIFKIVTAATAVETMGYTPKTPLSFNGGKYTLYKRQLTDTRDRHTTEVTLASAFAESINPVFGKIASTGLDPEKLAVYATAFGFNQGVDTDFFFDSGNLLLTDSAFQLAEVGCGFNKTTTISPMFGAMLVSTIVNRGNRPLPSMVKQITDTKGNVIYTSATSPVQKAISPETARAVRTMMAETILRGTAKRAFKGSEKDSTLSRLEIGGKTGSLNNRENTVRYDWFTGFAKEKNGEKSLALAVVVGHREYIGTRAATYARIMFKHYFNSYFVSNNKTTANRG